MNTKSDCGVSLQIDDYLDLLHFAIQIQDQEWQQSLYPPTQNISDGDGAATHT